LEIILKFIKELLVVMASLLDNSYTSIYERWFSKGFKVYFPKPKLSMENKLLATLEYLREYRSYAHIAASYNVHESQIVRGVKWVETTLIKDGTFRLSGRKELLKSDTEYEVILIDATERPKTGKNFTTWARKSNKISSYCQQS